MPKYYGVKCLTCDTPLILGLAVSTDLKQMPMYAAPLDPIPCPDCGGIICIRQMMFSSLRQRQASHPFIRSKPQTSGEHGLTVFQNLI
jgi:hypothetical protein